MIALLRGQVASLGEDHAVIDVGGVGYLVQCSGRTLGRLSVGEAASLKVVTQVREDAITLFGFLDPAEQTWFRTLQNIQGVGARSALAILGVLEPDEVTRAVSAGDKAPLTRAPGVGPRLAGRIVSELKDRIGSFPVSAAFAGSKGGTGGGAGVGAADDATADAITALVGLGYGRSEAFAAVLKVRDRLGEDAKLDALIRDSLKELSP